MKKLNCEKWRSSKMVPGTPLALLSPISFLGKPWDKFSKALIISNYKSIVTKVNFHLHLAMLEVHRVVKTEMSIWSNYTLLPDIFTKIL